MLFGWLKRMAREAVVAGVNEAVAELAGVGATPLPEARRTILLLPAYDEEPATQDAQEPAKLKGRVARVS